MASNHAIGARRDRLVIDTLQEWGTMDTEQIRLLYFSRMKPTSSLRIAQRRLQSLSNKGKVKRTREAIETPYSYYLKRHEPDRIALNWVRIWLMKRLKSWEIMESFDYGTNTCIIKNTVSGAVRTYNVFYNITRKVWIDGEVIIAYDCDELKEDAVKRGIKATLLTIEEIREGLRC